MPRKKRCIGVNDSENIVKMNCNKNNLSAKWTWTIDEQMLNLKTLRCLRADKKENVGLIRQLSMERCNMNARKQKWVCRKQGTRVKNKGTPNFTLQWIKPDDSSYFQNCNQQIYSYTGNVLHARLS